MPDYTNSDMRAYIDEHVHKARDRRILKLKYIDGLTHEEIAEVVQMSPRQIDTITRRFRETALILRP